MSADGRATLGPKVAWMDHLCGSSGQQRQDNLVYSKSYVANCSSSTSIRKRECSDIDLEFGAAQNNKAELEAKLFWVELFRFAGMPLS